MREFMFRAWEDGNMYYQVRVGGSFDGTPTAPTVWNEHIGDWVNLTGQPHTKVMQYIGLKDMNGIEIYEGDIIKYIDGYDSSTESGFDFEEFINTGIVDWADDEARYTVSDRESIGLEELFESIDEVEVIGNIYENPDLMNK